MTYYRYNFRLYDALLRAVQMIVLGAIVYTSHWAAGQPVADKGQTPDKQTAYQYGLQAVAAMEKQKDFDQALQLLQKAIQLDPKNTDYRYEMAYVYFGKGDYNTTQQILKKLLKKNEATPNYYLLLARAQEEKGQITDAEKTLQKALYRFPQAGQVYTELGGLAYKRGNNDAAVSFWEKGIEQAPLYTANYYWAAKLYFNSSEPIWGMLYAELFVQLEKNTPQRTTEMVQMLIKQYASLKPANNSYKSVHCSNMAKTILLLNFNISADSMRHEGFPLAYDLTLSEAYRPNVNYANIAALVQLRTDFIQSWCAHDLSRYYPNILFEWQKKAIDDGFFDTYNQWLFSQTSPASYHIWLSKNHYTYQNFAAWLAQNPFPTDECNSFFRMQYAQQED